MNRKSTWLFSACYQVVFVGCVLNILILAGEEAQQSKKEVTIMAVAIWALGFDDWHYRQRRLQGSPWKETMEYTE